MSTTLAFVLLLAATPARAEHWYKIASPHFTVVTNGSKSDGRHVAEQLERLRAAFHAGFPGLRLDLPLPVEILAVVGVRQFQSVEPSQNIGLSKVSRQGFWLPGEGQDLMLMQVNPDQHFQYASAENRNGVLMGEVGVGTGATAPAAFLPTYHDALHPNGALYKNYAALLIANSGLALPLWLRTGLAVFYENSNVVTQKVWLGLPDASALVLLRTYQMLPLAEIFKDTEQSSDYRDPLRWSEFEAACWVVTHYLFFHRAPGTPGLLPAYIHKVSQGVAPLAAAEAVFGNLGQLQSELADYIHALRLPYAQVDVSRKVNGKQFVVQKITQAEADGVRADVLVRVHRYEDAQTLLASLLKSDPDDARAVEDEAWLAADQSHWAEAENDFARATTLDPANFMPPFEYAKTDLRHAARGTGASATNKADDARDAASLQKSIQRNPAFAPAYDLLARLYLRQGIHLDQAHLLELHAIGLDPGVYAYRLRTARILLAMHRPADAIRVLHAAASLESTPAERDQAGAVIAAAQQREAQP